MKKFSYYVLLFLDWYLVMLGENNGTTVGRYDLPCIFIICAERFHPGLAASSVLQDTTTNKIEHEMKAPT